MEDAAWALTWMDLLANCVARYGKEWGTKYADEHHASPGFDPIVETRFSFADGHRRKQVSAVERFLGKGAPKDEVRKFRLTYTSLLIHEVIIHSADFCPDDPEAFQERFSRAVFKLVDPELRENLLHVANKNIEEHHRLLAGEIDRTMYVFRLCGRFLDGAPATKVAFTHPAIVAGFIDGMVETVEQGSTRS
jgi:hypothetical protein